MEIFYCALGKWSMQHSEQQEERHSGIFRARLRHLSLVVPFPVSPEAKCSQVLERCPYSFGGKYTSACLESSRCDIIPQTISADLTGEFYAPVSWFGDDWSANVLPVGCISLAWWPMERI